MNYHKPVLLNTVIDYLITNPSGKYFDATLGFGGHSIDILKKLNNDAKLIATDKDQDAFNYCKKQFSDDKRVSIYKTTFTNIDLIAKIEFIDKFDGILADLGVSSFQLDNLSSGFTYRQDVPLDLRMDKSKGKPAREILNYEGKKDLARIFREYGEEKKANIIARHVADSSLIKTMIAGGDPNWGRVAASIGSSGVSVKRDKVDIYFGKKIVMRNSVSTSVARNALLSIFKKKEIKIGRAHV